MFGISINGTHTYDDLNLIFVTRTIGEAQAQLKKVSVPCRNGSIDMSEVLTGGVCFSDRTITFTLRSFEKYESFTAVRDRLENLFAGKRCKIIFDDDKAYYWYGRVAVKGMTLNKVCADFSIECIVDPLKYSTEISTETIASTPITYNRSLINAYSNINVNGSTDVTVSHDDALTSFIVTVSDDMTVTVDGSTVSLYKGSNVVKKTLAAGDTVMTLNGHGVADINITGGSL